MGSKGVKRIMGAQLFFVLEDFSFLFENKHPVLTNPDLTFLGAS